MSELNPGHPMSETMRGMWHKIVAILMHRYEVIEVDITVEEIDALPTTNIAVFERDGKLCLRLVSDEDAKRLASVAGGLLQ